MIVLLLSIVDCVWMWNWWYFINVVLVIILWRMCFLICDKLFLFIFSVFIIIFICFVGKKECQVECGWSCRIRFCRIFFVIKKLVINRCWLLKVVFFDILCLFLRLWIVIWLWWIWIYRIDMRFFLLCK